MPRLIAEPLPKPTAGTALRHVRVKPDWLRVRDEPSTQGRILMELPRGTELIVLEERGDWLRVARPAGWVHEDYVRDTGQG
jgi:hypothetical protein